MELNVSTTDVTPEPRSHEGASKPSPPHRRPFCKTCKLCRMFEVAIRYWAETPELARITTEESSKRGGVGEVAGRVLDMARTSRSLAGNIGRDLEAFGFSVVSGPFGSAAPPATEIVIEYDLADGDAPATFRFLSPARTVSMTVPELHATYVRLYDLGAGATKDELLAALGVAT